MYYNEFSYQAIFKVITNCNIKVRLTHVCTYDNPVI